MKKLFLIATPICLFAALLCQFLLFKMDMTGICWNLFLFFGLGYMYYRGTLKNTVSGRLIYIALAIFLIGLLFKLQHWPYAGTLILSGLAAIIVIYTIRFILKRPKKLLDWMKVIAVVVKAIAFFVWISHWPYREELLTISTAMLIALVIVFYMRVIKGDEDEKLEQPIANSGNDVFNYKD